MVAMDLLEAIDVRRSRRKYEPVPLPGDAVKTLGDLIAKLNAQDGVRLELVLDNGAAFDSLRRSYGMFTGVRHYVGLIADSDPHSREKLGYDTELVNLTAVTLGLGTCIVGGSFDRQACPFALAGDESVAAVMTLGIVPAEASAKEKLVRGVMHRRTKTPEQLTDAAPPWPAWFTAGLEAVQKAPSAINRQPVTFSLKDGIASASVPDGDEMMPIDLGIAKRHFALGAGGGAWTWGSGGVFRPSS